MSTKRSVYVSLMLWAAGVAILTAQELRAVGNKRPAAMDRQTEIALALSSCPSTLASKAALYVLEPAGYVKVRDSQNGFTAIVQHSVPASQEPQCLDDEAARTFLPRMLKVAEMRAQGKSGDDIQRFMADALTNRTLPTPTRAGVIYMLSSENRIPNGKGVIGSYPPHVMFYGTKLTNADLGVDASDVGPDGNPKAPTFVAGDGSPYALIIVPVRLHAATEEGK